MNGAQVSKSQIIRPIRPNIFDICQLMFKGTASAATKCLFLNNEIIIHRPLIHEKQVNSIIVFSKIAVTLCLLNKCLRQLFINSYYVSKVGVYCAGWIC